MPSEHLSLAGISIDALTEADLIDKIQDATDTDKHLLILNHNLHSLYLYQVDPGFRATYALADWVYVDGVPVIWLARAAGLPLTREHRTTFLHQFDSILGTAAERNWRVFYLGSKPAVLEEGLDTLGRRHPTLNLRGHHGYFEKSGPESEAVIATINAFRPTLLFVGLGMPTQERWLTENYSRIEAGAVTTSGATLDYVTGHAYKPPAWAGPLGLYGMFRLFSDPRRLGRRYLIEPLILLWRLGIPILQQRWDRHS